MAPIPATADLGVPPGHANHPTLDQWWKVRMLAGWAHPSGQLTKPFPSPWEGFVAVGMRKLGRMSSRLVTATLPGPRPAPPGGPAPLPAPA
jgi:hypothetical protein